MAIREVQYDGDPIDIKISYQDQVPRGLGVKCEKGSEENKVVVSYIIFDEPDIAA